MQRFFLNPECFIDQQVTFPKEITHQIIHVLRLNNGDPVIVLDNSGVCYQVDLQINPQEMKVTGVIKETRTVTSEPKTHLTLAFGLSSREKVEWILQKGTEIGVSIFYPFISSRTLVRSTAISPKKYSRWEGIIREAAEQSGRGKLPVLHQPLDFTVIMSELNKSHDLCLLAWEGATDGGENLTKVIKGFLGLSLGMVVGPEGGFSEDEVKIAVDAGCRVVSLGARILRMETAAMIIPALVLNLLGEL